MNIEIKLTPKQLAAIRAEGDTAVRTERDQLAAWFGDWLNAELVEDGLACVGELEVFVDDMLDAIGCRGNGDILESYNPLLVRIADLTKHTIDELASYLTPEQLAEFNDDMVRSIDYPTKLAQARRELRVVPDGTAS